MYIGVISLFNLYIRLVLSLAEKDFMYSDGVAVSSRKICIMKKWYGKLVALYYNYDVRYFYLNLPRTYRNPIAIHNVLFNQAQ